MQVTLNQAEIERAIIAFVGNQGISITGKNVEVTLVAGRGPQGMTASIDISNDDLPPVGPITRKKKDAQPDLPFSVGEDSTAGVTKPVTAISEDAEKIEEKPDANKPLFGNFPE